MSLENDTIIKIEHVSKKYRLGAIGGTTLRDEIHRKTAKLLHKEDPTLMIGQKAFSSHEEFYALTDVSIEIKKGEAVGIIGHNGAGKSTLLKLLCRVTAPTEGTISYNGRITSMLEVGTGFHPELTGRENIYLNGAILGMSKKEIDSKIDDIIEFSECRQFIDTPVKRYSSGMKVKLAFSVSAHLDSEIMIMDEVLAVGDMAFQKKCLLKMKEAATKEGKTVLYVSHNMNTIRQLCERCIVINKGEIVFDGGVEKAISIYLDQSQETHGSVIDLADYKRPNNINGQAFMECFKFVGTESNVFIRGKKLKFHLFWKSNATIDNVRFRMIIRFQDDSPVGLVQSGVLGSYKMGSRQTNGFEFDTSLLSEGTYFLSIALYQNDELGNSVILDHITRAVSIDILNDNSDKSSLNWEHRYWGSVHFPDFTIIE